VQAPQAKKLIISSTSSVSRLASEKALVAKELKAAEVQDHLERVARPKSLSGGMKKLGIALIAAPDPITGVPGVALLASSYVMKRREPVGLTHLAQETKKVLREMQSLRI
jgi:hypothetical protein